jgi:hypothetical protein
MPIDPRQIAALQIQIDAMADALAQDGDRELTAALDQLRKALNAMHKIVDKRGLYLTLPHDYKPPYVYLTLLPDYKPPYTGV